MTILVSLLVTMTIYLWMKLSHPDVIVAEIILLVSVYFSVIIPLIFIPLRLRGYSLDRLKESKTYSDIFVPENFKTKVLWLISLLTSFIILSSFVEERGFTMVSVSTLVVGIIIMISTVGSNLMKSDTARVTFLYVTVIILYLVMLSGLYWFQTAEEYIKSWVFCLATALPMLIVITSGLQMTEFYIRRELK